MKVVIIGGVAGGATAAARLRRLDEHAEIVVLERSGYVSYANCGLPYYVGGVIQNKKTLTLQTPQSFKTRFNIDVRVHSEAVAIDRVKKEVRVRETESGREYTERYDKLILSPGARAVVPPVAGAESPRVFTLRTVEDTFRIAAYIAEKGAGRAVVIGGGFVGLEMAENLTERGIGVTLCEGSPQVLPQTDADMACFLHARLRAAGIDLRLNAKVLGFAEEGDALTVRTEKGDVRADFALLAVGVAPDTALAAAAGLELGARGGIVVDEHMRTSDKDIYAVGDAVLVKNALTGAVGSFALAGPANRAGQDRRGQRVRHPVRLPRRAGLVRAQTVRHDGGVHGALGARGKGGGHRLRQGRALLREPRHLLPRRAEHDAEGALPPRKRRNSGRAGSGLCGHRKAHRRARGGDPREDDRGGPAGARPVLCAAVLFCERSRQHGGVRHRKRARGLQAVPLARPARRVRG